MGITRLMKDILGKEIKLGDHVVYIQCAANKNFEEAIVIENNNSFIKIEYSGMGSETKSWVKKKKHGEKSRLTVTNKKIIILNANYFAVDRDIYQEKIERIEKEMKSIKKQLNVSLKRERTLMDRNDILQAEVDKIHSRFDILDI